MTTEQQIKALAELTCQMTMSDNGKSATGVEHFWLCGKPAKFWIKDQFNRTGFNGRQLLCGTHAHHYNKKAKRLNRPEATPL